MEQKNQEQDNRLTDIEAKNQEQDQEQEAHAIKLAGLKQKNQEQDNRFTATEAKDLEQDNRLTELESKGKTQEQLYNVSTHTLVHDFSNEAQTFHLVVKEKNEDGKVFGHLTFKYIDQRDQTIVHTIPLSQLNGRDFYVFEYDGYHYDVANLILSEETLESLGYTITVSVNINIYRIMGSLVLNSVLYKETPNTDNEHIVTISEEIGDM